MLRLRVSSPRFSTQAIALLPALYLGAALAEAPSVEPLADQPVTDTVAEVAGTPEPRTETFDIWEYRVEGNTLLPLGAIERAVYPWLGPQRRIADVEGARESLETRYRDAGYATVLVNIPEQDVLDGVVRLEVIEGKVDRLRVTGSRYFSPGRIRSEVPGLAAGEVPHLPTLQAELAAANRASPDRRIVPVLRPGRAPGTVEAELQIDDKLPLHGNLVLNNQYTQDTTELRLNASLRYDNLWQRYHSVGLQYQVAPEDPEEVSALAGTYVFPVADGRDRVALYAVDSDSNVATLGGTNVVGAGNIYGLRYVRPFSGGETRFHSLTFGVDYKDMEDSIRLATDRIETPIDYLMLSADFATTLLGAEQRTNLRLGAFFGPRGFGLGNAEGEFEDKRFKAEPNFLYLRASLDHERNLPNDFSLRAALSGQLADEPLVSSEQFSVGGAESVRGYPESVALGDRGLRGSLELLSPSLTRYLSIGEGSLRAGLFLDGATVKIVDPLPGQAGSYTLLGTGLSLDASHGNWSAHLDWAWPLRDLDRIEAGEGRWHFHVGYEF